MIDFNKLAAPFPPDKVHWRVGSTNKDKTRGLALAYIDARDVMDRLDEVCGPENWQCRYPHANGKTVCEIGLRILSCDGPDDNHTDACMEWVWKADGAGDTDYEAEKGALSDAFKRAAVRWGIGRYLYDLPAVWVEIEPAGKSFKIKDGELARLQKLLTGGGGAKPPAPDTRAYERALAERLVKASSEAELDLIWRAEGATIKAFDRPTFERIVRMFKDRKAEIQARSENTVLAAG